MPPLPDKLKGVRRPGDKRREPLWEGPQGDGLNGGITYSLLARWLVCRERFRVYAIEGLHTEDGFNHKIFYGNAWHVCEEAFAKHVNPVEAHKAWKLALHNHCMKLCQVYPLQREQIDHWYNVCMVQFPIYVDWWAKHPDMEKRTPLFQEQVFNVPYRLTSGRTVRLRGKWDSVDLATSHGLFEIWLQENKSKSEIDSEQIERQLKFDLQTMLYLVTLREFVLGVGKEIYRSRNLQETNIAGVRYNVIRRPLSGGKGTIRRHQATKNQPEETKGHFYGRVRDVILEDPASYFQRWNVRVTTEDIQKFRERCLDPILEQLCDWYAYVTGKSEEILGNGLHWQHPFGVWNGLNDGGSSDLDAYLETGSEVGLCRADTLFPELETK